MSFEESLFFLRFFVKFPKMKCESVHSEIYKDEQFYHKQIFEEDNIIKKRFRRIVIRGKPLFYLDVL